MQGQWKGFLCVAGAALMWGLAGNVAKFLFNHQVNPVDLAQVRLFLSFLFLAAYLAFLRRPLFRVARAHYLPLTVLGIFGLTAVQITYLLAISRTNVATAIFLQYLAPVLIMGYGLVVKIEKLTAANGLALACSVLGGFLMVKGTPGGGLAVSPAGLASGLASALALAFYTIYGKRWLAVYSPWTILLWGFGCGSILFCLYRLPWLTFLRYGPEEWLFFIYVAIFSSIIPFGLYIKGLQYLSAVKANLTSTLEPVLAGLLAYLLLAERLTAWQVAGGGLILGGVILIQLAGAPKTAPKTAGRAEIS
ncbi:MAG: EamA family transporter [Armatimonadetes bacterium]|nr:EamA family transporter [Armatimonadota bacterium]